MNDPVTKTFTATGPIDVQIDVPSGDIDIEAIPTDLVTVEVHAPEDAGVVVALNDGRLQITVPRPTGWLASWRAEAPHLRVVVPHGSSLRVHAVSAETHVRGSWRALILESQSGDIRISAECTTLAATSSSGDIDADHAPVGAVLRSGSGDLRVGHCASDASLSAGSGDVTVGSMTSGGSLKTGSGGVNVGTAGGEIALSTGSGDAHIQLFGAGRLTGRAGSGSILVGLPVGMPVWTDLRSNSGDVRSTLPPAGPPVDGQDHAEVRLVTGSGDISLVPQEVLR